jgi:poly(3-hydroxybutyrate) depolymerase
MMWASILVTVLCASTGGALSIPPTNLASRGLASCGKPLPLGQSIGHVSNVTISSGGNERNFLVSIPPSYSKDVPTPLMLSYHGGTKTSIQQLQLDDLTDPEFNPFAIVVYPQGINVRGLSETDGLVR